MNKKEELKKYREIREVSFDHDGAHIALCHAAQGGSANGWHNPLLLKSKEAVVNIEVLKSLQELGELSNIDKSLYRNTLKDLLSKAIREKEYFDEYEYFCIYDFNDTSIIVTCGEGLHLIPYTLQGLEVTLGDVGLPVVMVTDYQEVNGELILSEELEDLIESEYGMMIAKSTTDPKVLEVFKATKKVGSETLKASDYAYVPDPEKTSTWKLRIDTARHVAAAVAALGKGFRGNVVEIPEEDLPTVKKKVRAAYKKFYPENEVPTILKSAITPLISEDSEINKSFNEDTQSTKTKGDHVSTKTLPTDDILKSQEMQEILKEQIEKATKEKDLELQKALQAIEVLEKAEKKRRETGFTNIIKSLQVVDEADVAPLVSVLMKSEEDAALILATLEKAANEVKSVKEQFSVEIGTDTGNRKIEKSQQELLDEKIKAAAGLFNKEVN